MPAVRPIRAPRSYPFPKDFEELLDWSHADDRIDSARNYWIVTVSSDGSPHATPIWGVWLDHTLFIDGHPRSRWVSNALARSAVCVHLEGGDDVVILEGVVEDIPKAEAELGGRIIKAWVEKYGDIGVPDALETGLLRLDPVRGRGWSQNNLRDGAAWEFDR